MIPKLPSRRWGPFRQEWYSICSAHQKHSADCKTCNVGSWINVWRRRVGSFVYKRWPRLWRWWANFPSPKMSLEQKERQRRSFVYGNTKLANDSIAREIVDDAAKAVDDEAARKQAAYELAYKFEDELMPNGTMGTGQGMKRRKAKAEAAAKKKDES